MKCLVIGYGSIGARHARVLRELGFDVAVVSRREIGFTPNFKNLNQGLSSFHPDYVVIANRTSEHFETLMELSKSEFKGTLLLEKPIFDNPHKVVELPFASSFVAYNLRFHPLLQRMRKLLLGRKIISASVYTGSYLPNWRPNTDYRECYSAKKELGGGVLWDLSHELDYILWYCGSWKRVSALGGHFSNLEITSDDTFTLLFETEKCPAVHVHINYTDKIGQRLITINTDQGTLRADLMRGILNIDSDTESVIVDRDDTYKGQHLAVMKKDFSTLCTFKEGEDVMSLIAAAERSVQEKTWVTK